MDDQRQRLPTDERREHLMEIAEQLCAELGPEGLKLREVARRAGISAPSIYNHFKSLEDLLAAVVGKHLRQMLTVYDDVADLAPAEAMAHVCRQHCTYLGTRPGVARLLQADLHTPHGSASVNKVEQQILTINAAEHRLIKQGCAAGVFRDVVPTQVTTARIGMTLTLLAMKWFGTADISPQDLDDLSQTVCDFVLRYLLAAPA